ncbi:MAG: tyrosine-type recombinase/integrase, partial [Myxococcales bacterium]|nr:tyrosine-type recombinase/integrase [Myxococcales bacterium]
MRDALARFLEHLEHEVRVSPHTLRAYAGDIEALLATIEARRGREPTPADFDQRELRAHLAALHTRRASPSSMARALSAVRSFGEFMRRAGLVADNAATLVRRPKQRKPLPVALPVEDITAIIDAPGHRAGVLGERDRAVLEVLYGAGLRVSECVALNLPDLRWHGDELELRVVRGKGGKDRVAPLGTRGAAALRRYLAARDGLLRPGPRTDALFLNRRGRRLGERSVRELVYRRCLATGARARVGPHGLRHSFATH